jgi:hypothetical protein
MKTFAAACILSTALAFDLSVIKPLVMGDYTIETPNAPKTKRLAGIPQIESVPVVQEDAEYKAMIAELVADRKACAADATADCNIDDDMNGHKLGSLLNGVTAGFNSLLDSNETIETQAIDKINENTNAQIDAQIKAANVDAKAQLIHDVSRGKINVTKLNKIHESKADTIKETSEDNSHDIAKVAKEATKVEIMNKATKSNLINDLFDAAKIGESTSAVLAKADKPVALDDHAIFGGFGGNFNAFGDGAFDQPDFGNSGHGF